MGMHLTVHLMHLNYCHLTTIYVHVHVLYYYAYMAAALGVFSSSGGLAYYCVHIHVDISDGFVTIVQFVINTDTKG